jgi:TusE/DsrC/DsvC family sulfur relay protein
MVLRKRGNTHNRPARALSPAASRLHREALDGRGGDILVKSKSTADQGSRVEAETTAQAAISETPVEIDERGFMTDPSQWTPGAALFLARRQGVHGWPRELASDHWRVIDFMRTYHQTAGNAPSLRYTCKALGMTKKRFSRLFPGGLTTVRRISGLPGPRKAANRRERLLARDWWGFLTGH